MGIQFAKLNANSLVVWYGTIPSTIQRKMITNILSLSCLKILVFPTNSWETRKYSELQNKFTNVETPNTYYHIHIIDSFAWYPKDSTDRFQVRRRLISSEGWCSSRSYWTPSSHNALYCGNRTRRSTCWFDTCWTSRKLPCILKREWKWCEYFSIYMKYLLEIVFYSYFWISILQEEK